MATAQLPISSNVTEFLSRPRKMLINNQWVESVSGQSFPVYNPATGKKWPAFPRATRRISISP